MIKEYQSPEVEVLVYDQKDVLSKSTLQLYGTTAVDKFDNSWLGNK